MPIRAVVFDIGGVLEITPPTGWNQRWEARLHLPAGALDDRLADVWRAGGLGAISEAEVERRIRTNLGLDQTRLDAFMRDLWDEYLGSLNVELTNYFTSLRPRYQTAILSNSFVGAREKEQERYHFGDLCDLIIYSHEEGLEKPDPRFFALLCERLRVQPAEVIFLDDVAAVVAAARAFGLHAIRFNDTEGAIAAIEDILRAHSTEN